jgi:hypothetical protein
MIKDHVRPASDVDRALAAVAADPLTKAKESNDDISRAAERDRMAIKSNAIARSRLAGDCYVARNRHIGFEPDDSADAEDHDSPAFTDCIAKRTRPEIIQVGDGIGFSTASAGGQRTETFGAGEGGKRVLGCHLDFETICEQRATKPEAFHFPIQNKCFSPRKNICPLLMAGEA